jgi:hypothetical protein
VVHWAGEGEVAAMARVLVQPAPEQAARRLAVQRLAAELNARAAQLVRAWVDEAGGAPAAGSRRGGGANLGRCR